MRFSQYVVILTLTPLFQKIAEGLCVKPLVDAIEKQPELWKEITARQEHPTSVHKDTEAIFLRWCKGHDVASVFEDLEAVDYPAAEKLMPAAGVVFNQLLSAVGDFSQVGRVMVVKLKHRGVINEHVDEGRYAEHYDRFHVVLTSQQPGNKFFVSGNYFEGKPGEAYWFNHKRSHSVINMSSADRLHMIVDVVAPEFRARRGTYFQQERARDLWPEITPLLEKHWQEIAHYPDIPLAPDVARYNAMDDAGVIRCYTARHGGKLVGYAIFVVGPNLHYSSSNLAIQDVLFIDPEYRRGRVGMQLIDFCEKRLASEKVQVTYQHVKEAHPALARLLEAKGYEKVDSIWAKRL